MHIYVYILYMGTNKKEKKIEKKRKEEEAKRKDERNISNEKK